MVIGIGGSSRSGKSTLANLLVSHYTNCGKHVIVLHQDEFVISENLIPKIKNKIDWESPKSINHDLLLKAVLEFKLKYDVIIVEGFLVFFDTDLVTIFDKKLFVEISKSTFLVRKTLDIRWGNISKWYIKHIWKSFMTIGRPKNLDTDYFIVSGENEFKIKEIINYLC